MASMYYLSINRSISFITFLHSLALSRVVRCIQHLAESIFLSMKLCKYRYRSLTDRLLRMRMVYLRPRMGRQVYSYPNHLLFSLILPTHTCMLHSPHRNRCYLGYYFDLPLVYRYWLGQLRFPQSTISMARILGSSRHIQHCSGCICLCLTRWYPSNNITGILVILIATH
jgi:hypothetical protein